MGFEGDFGQKNGESRFFLKKIGIFRANQKK